MSETDIEVWQHGFVKGFDLKPYNEKLHASILGYYNNHEVEYIIRRPKKRPTMESHGYYRGVILPCAQASNIFGGWNLEEIHKFFASEFLKDVITTEINGRIFITTHILSTGSISKKQMAKFIQDVIQWLAENGVTNIPQPSTQKDKTHEPDKANSEADNF